MASLPMVRGFGDGAPFAYRKGCRITIERFLSEASRLAAALYEFETELAGRLA